VEAPCAECLRKVCTSEGSGGAGCTSDGSGGAVHRLSSVLPFVAVCCSVLQWSPCAPVLSRVLVRSIVCRYIHIQFYEFPDVDWLCSAPVL